MPIAFISVNKVGLFGLPHTSIIKNVFLYFHYFFLFFKPNVLIFSVAGEKMYSSVIANTGG